MRLIPFFVLLGLILPFHAFVTHAMAAEFVPANLPVANLQPSPPAEKGSDSGLPLPRFASLKSDHSFLRSGPSMDYPIKWVYRRENLPVEIIQEFDAWRKIRDPGGEVGWVNKILLSGERTVLLKSRDMVPVWSVPPQTPKPIPEGNILASLRTPPPKIEIARAEPQVIARVLHCLAHECELDLGPVTGWVEKKYLWGVYGSEILN
jgi:SH3-like domain-containing protein